MGAQFVWMAPGAAVNLNSIVIVSLHTPREKIWGELVDLNTAGITMRGIDLNSFDDFVRQVLHPEGDRVGLATLFFPMQRVERNPLDPLHGKEERGEAHAVAFGMQYLAHEIVERVQVDAAHGDARGIQINQFSPDLFAWRMQADNYDRIQVHGRSRRHPDELRTHSQE